MLKGSYTQSFLMSKLKPTLRVESKQTFEEVTECVKHSGLIKYCLVIGLKICD